jgi:hypothetical protein
MVPSIAVIDQRGVKGAELLFQGKIEAESWSQIARQGPVEHESSRRSNVVEQRRDGDGLLYAEAGTNTIIWAAG